MKISMIVAVAENGAIGKDNKMLWHIPEDFKYFKATTMGKPIIMGRKTYESIGRALPGRLNIVVTRDASWQAKGVSIVHDLGAAILLAEGAGTQEAFIIGGMQMYAQYLDKADKIYVTEVHKKYPDADTFFPKLDKTIWSCVFKEDHKGDGEKTPDYSFLVWEK